MTHTLSGGMPATATARRGGKPDAAKIHTPHAGARRVDTSDAARTAKARQARAAGAFADEDEQFLLLLASDAPPAANVIAPALITTDAATADAAPAQDTASAMALWARMEPEVAAALAASPPCGMAVTLLLPTLGAVDARFAPLGSGGWDIALRFEPRVWSLLAQSRERCRQTLRRRLACRINLTLARRENVL